MEIKTISLSLSKCALITMFNKSVCTSNCAYNHIESETPLQEMAHIFILCMQVKVACTLL